MNTHADKTPDSKSQTVVRNDYSAQSGSESSFQFADNRSEATTQRKLNELANNSQNLKQAAQLKSLADNYPGQTIQKVGIEEEEPLQGKFIPVQRQGIEEEELLQGKFEPVQMMEEEELLQGKFETIQKKASPEYSRRENKTGLPDQLKSGIENLSGHSMDDVNVHYNSDKPAQLNAHAYAQGTDIHLASGQEKHLPHEAWHVVQQKQGRVKPTMQLKGHVNVNDDEGLEREADVMGAKAVQRKLEHNDSSGVDNTPEKIRQGKFKSSGAEDTKQLMDEGSGIMQFGGAVANPNGERNYNAIGYGIQGIRTLSENIMLADNPICNVGVMARYPVGINYFKGKGGHAALQVDVDLGKGGEHQYLQAGVSATGSIQVEPTFQTIKTREGYNIKRITKSVDKDICISTLKKTAAEIAKVQDYQERILYNSGTKTNCALWASNMAAQAGLDLGTNDKWFLPSPNDVQGLMENFRNKEGITITEEKTVKSSEGEIASNVGVEATPGWDNELEQATGVMPEEQAKKLMEEALQDDSTA